MPLDHTALLPALPGSGARCRDGQDVRFCEDQSALCGEAPGLPVFRVQAAHTRAFRGCSQSRCPAQSWMGPVPLEVPSAWRRPQLPTAPGPGGPLAPGSPSPCFSLLFNHTRETFTQAESDVASWGQGPRPAPDLAPPVFFVASASPRPSRSAQSPFSARVKAGGGVLLPRAPGQGCPGRILPPKALLASPPGHTHPRHGAWAVPKPTGTPSSMCPQAAVTGPRARACVPLETSPGLERHGGAEPATRGAQEAVLGPGLAGSALHLLAGPGQAFCTLGCEMSDSAPRHRGLALGLPSGTIAPVTTCPENRSWGSWREQAGSLGLDAGLLTPCPVRCGGLVPWLGACALFCAGMCSSSSFSALPGLLVPGMLAVLVLDTPGQVLPTVARTLPTPPQGHPK